MLVAMPARFALHCLASTNTGLVVQEQIGRFLIPVCEINIAIREDNRVAVNLGQNQSSPPLAALWHLVES
jgi:hypothetical protein